MRYIPDPTGRFSHRPFYEPGELDVECERILVQFTGQAIEQFTFPITTDTLTKLIERDAADLDLYADLSEDGLDVEGVTDFYPGERPRVRIATELSEHESRLYRLRTTLTHEYGHIWLHAPLFDALAYSPQMFPELVTRDSQRCKREAIVTAQKTDWMEWQAGYVCGALLMPETAVRRLVTDFRRSRGGRVMADGSIEARALQQVLQSIFQVSLEAARVRLLQLNCLANHTVPAPQF
jgi:hypothetical protein